MRGRWIYAVIFLITAAAVFAAVLISGNLQKQIPESFTLNGRTYGITAYAYTVQQREAGLMNATVTNSTFMLFYFNSSGVYPFWMKNTYNALDIIWLNYTPSTGTARVVYLVNAIPCASYDSNQQNCIIYTPPSYANYVLETKAGFAERNGIGIGTVLQFR